MTSGPGDSRWPHAKSCIPSASQAELAYGSMAMPSPSSIAFSEPLSSSQPGALPEKGRFCLGDSAASHRLIKSSWLEKILKIMKSNCYHIPGTNSCP